MRTKGRKRSNNIEDRRAYFGSESRSPMPQAGRVNMFINESMKSSREFKVPQDYNRFQKPVQGGAKKDRK